MLYVHFASDNWLVGFNFPQSTIMYIFPKYVSAFLNGNGGAIYFGIADDGRIHGIRVDRCVFVVVVVVCGSWFVVCGLWFVVCGWFVCLFVVC